MNIQMKSPVFDVIHVCMQFIQENTIRMTFRVNARTFSTNFLFGQLFSDGGSTLYLILPPFGSTCPCEFFLRVLIRCLFGHFHVDFGTLFTTTMACAFYLAPLYAE
jgi:hypothetical protein